MDSSSESPPPAPRPAMAQLPGPPLNTVPHWAEETPQWHPFQTMGDVEIQLGPKPSRDGVGAKLWSFYISEAEKYDKALIESWKGDMKGMVIFAGLFSASLTAFLIESYKTLSPDSGDTAIQLLAQISQQLAATNENTFIPSPSPPFVPSVASLVCNTLWFLSLGLSLGCALIAILLEQWSREFLHRADMHSAPPVRARMYSFLYYGLKRFNMHAVVEIIPLLLHASLLLFFGGLVAFLIPINTIIAVVAGIILAIVTGAYSFLTILPLISMDSPYHTPLSSIIWDLVQSFRSYSSPAFRRTRMGSKDNGASIVQTRHRETIAESTVHSATDISPERLSRDHKALAWTMKSLVDDEQLEPFVETIPDVLWGRHGRQYIYDGHVYSLVINPEVAFMDRLHSLFLSSATGILTEKAKRRRRITFYRSLSAILSIYGAANPSKPMPHLLDDKIWLTSLDPLVTPFKCSALALWKWQTFKESDVPLIPILKVLKKCQQDNTDPLLPNLRRAQETLTRINQLADIANQVGNLIVRPESVSAKHLISAWILEIERWQTDTTTNIVVGYLEDAATLGAPPYLFEDIIKLIAPTAASPQHAYHDVEVVLDKIIYNQVDRFNVYGTSASWLDELVAQLVKYWYPENEASTLPHSLIHFLSLRNSDSARHTVASAMTYNAHLICVPATLIHIKQLTASSEPPSTVHTTLRDDSIQIQTLNAVWEIISGPSGTISGPSGTINGPSPYGTWFQSPLPVYMIMLDSLVSMPTSSLTTSILALVKARILSVFQFPDGFSMHATPEDLMSQFRHPIFPIETAVQVPDETLYNYIVEHEEEEFRKALQTRVQEVRIVLISEFLDSCRLDSLPHRACDTLRSVASGHYSSKTHTAHQIRFAKSVQDLFAATLGHIGPDLLRTAIDLQPLAVYAQWGEDMGFRSTPQPYPWLENSVAREILKDTFTRYRAITINSGSNDPIVYRLEGVINGLDAFHPVSEHTTLGELEEFEEPGNND